jgi:hypothetical protein
MRHTLPALGFCGLALVRRLAVAAALHPPTPDDSGCVRSRLASPQLQCMCSGRQHRGALLCGPRRAEGEVGCQSVLQWLLGVAKTLAEVPDGTELGLRWAPRGPQVGTCVAPVSLIHPHR